MSNMRMAVSMVLLGCGVLLAADQPGSAVVKPFAWGIGYDEGISAKLFLTQRISVNLGVGYSVMGADSVYKQPINSALFKVGGAFLLTEFEKLRINAFVDFAETMNEGQLAPTIRPGPNFVYYQWNSSGRIGLAPEVFVTDHFSVTYKIGAIVTYYGTTYKLNANESDIEEKDDGYVEGGILGFKKNAPLLFLQSISLYFYF